MKVYISGAMASRMSSYKEIFAFYEQRLKAQGYIVINPATMPIGLNPDRYMPICLSMIDAADAIFMIEGWEQSRGACLEKAYAEYQGKDVMYDGKTEKTD